MDSGDLTSDQITTLQAAVRVRAGYFQKLAGRMAAQGFREDDEILVATKEIHAKMQAIWLRLNCLGTIAFKREFEAAERKAKMMRRKRR